MSEESEKREKERAEKAEKERKAKEFRKNNAIGSLTRRFDLINPKKKNK